MAFITIFKKFWKIFILWSVKSSKPSSNLSADEAYKILGLKKGCSKEDVIKAANGLQKKIHPDVNPNSNTERLSQIVNEAKETDIKRF